MKTIFVSNLNFALTEDDVKAVFAPFGDVFDVRMPMSKETGRSRGLAFVDMAEAGVDAAVRELDGAEVRGRKLRVKLADRLLGDGTRRRW